MTREETARFLGEMMNLYPSIERKNEDYRLTVQLWQESLSDFTLEDMHKALINYFQSDTKGYAPTAGQLIEIKQAIDEKEKMWDDLL